MDLEHLKRALRAPKAADDTSTKVEQQFANGVVLQSLHNKLLQHRKFNAREITRNLCALSSRNDDAELPYIFESGPLLWVRERHAPGHGADGERVQVLCIPDQADKRRIHLHVTHTFKL